MNARPLRSLLVAALAALASTGASPEEPASSDVTQANNPIANFTALNFHNYYLGELTGSEENGNTLWARYAKPFSIGDSQWLTRTSLPINTYPVAPSYAHETGVGDLNFLAVYLFDTGNPAIRFGMGPQLTAPTASKDSTGSGKWSAGFAANLFNATSREFQWGFLVTWQASFAGDDDRAKVNTGAFQPLLIWQLGGGNYLRSTALMTYDFENDAYCAPVGFGFGRVIRKGDTVYNIFIEPQVSVADKGAAQPRWQVLLGVNLQFK